MEAETRSACLQRLGRTFRAGSGRPPLSDGNRAGCCLVVCCAHPRAPRVAQGAPSGAGGADCRGVRHIMGGRDDRELACRIRTGLGGGHRSRRRGFGSGAQAPSDGRRGCPRVLGVPGGHPRALRERTSRRAGCLRCRHPLDLRCDQVRDTWVPWDRPGARPSRPKRIGAPLGLDVIVTLLARVGPSRELVIRVSPEGLEHGSPHLGYFPGRCFEKGRHR